MVEKGEHLDTPTMRVVVDKISQVLVPTHLPQQRCKIAYSPVQRLELIGERRDLFLEQLEHRFRVRRSIRFADTKVAVQRGRKDR